MQLIKESNENLDNWGQYVDLENIFGNQPLNNEIIYINRPENILIKYIQTDLNYNRNENDYKYNLNSKYSKNLKNIVNLYLINNKNLADEDNNYPEKSKNKFCLNIVTSIVSFSLIILLFQIYKKNVSF
jgi:hypothetical protein